MRSTHFTVGALVLLGCIGSDVCAQQLSLIPVKPMVIEGNLVDGEGAGPAKDVSGMACLPAQAASRMCLLINDENKKAQLVTIDGDRMSAGRVVPLIGKEPDPRTLGSPPAQTCREADDFKDLDGEGVAYAEPYFYVIGSHGCSRKKDKFRLSSFILARVRVDRQGQPIDSAGRPLAPDDFAGAVETTYRVSDLLKRAGAAAKFFGKDLESENGLTIEGIAVQGDTIWFGLRAPVDENGIAFLVRGNVADLFKAGNAASEVAPTLVRLPLEGLGIRDLALLPDNRLLVIAGAPHGKEVPFRLFVVDPAVGDVKPIGQLAAVTQRDGQEMKTGKLEGVTVLETAADKARIVVLFDSLPNGAPHQAEISIPK